MNVKVCSQCGAENDSTRVYCQNCGTRLPEELTKASQPVAEEGAPSQPARSAPALPVARGWKAAKPPKEESSGLLSVLVRQIFFTAVMAAILAALIQMVRTPDAIPPAVPLNAAAAETTFATMRQCATSPSPGSWTVNEAAINEFIISTVQMQSSGSKSSLQAEFRRAFVVLREGSAGYFVEQAMLGGNLFFELQFEPEVVSGHLQAKVIGAAIGRLPVHPSLAPLIMPLFRPSLSGLEQALDMLKNASGATITVNEVVVKWPGSSSTPP